MADQKISQLNALTGANTASGDLLTIVDINDTTMGASGTNKKMTLTEFQASPVSAGTANGVVFLNGSKVETSGSALTFDGTNFATTGTASAAKLIPTGGTATGNGMYLPSANTLGFSTNGVLNMSLDASGNLGIGTASPAATFGDRVLQITGTASANSELRFTHTTSGSGSGDGLTLLLSGDNAFLFNRENGYLAFATNNTERMRLDASGNLGIGTASPGAKLDVVGDIRLNTAGSQFLYASTSGVVQSGVLLDSGNAKIDFYTNGTLKATLDLSGNLGIGTASPAVKFVVSNGGANGVEIEPLGFSSDNVIQSYNRSGAAYTSLVYNALNHRWALSGVGGAMTLDASGNLGLNTSTFGTSAAGVLSIANGTAPTTGPADTVQLFSVDRSAGNTIPAVRCEGSGVTNAGITNTTVTHKIAMQVNGTIYYLLATTNAT
jgi:hypothetical protein